MSELIFLCLRSTTRLRCFFSLAAAAAAPLNWLSSVSSFAFERSFSGVYEITISDGVSCIYLLRSELRGYYRPGLEAFLSTPISYSTAVILLESTALLL